MYYDRETGTYRTRDGEFVVDEDDFDLWLHERLTQGGAQGELYIASTPKSRAKVRAALADGKLRREPITTIVASLLDISHHELTALRRSRPYRNIDRAKVLADLCARFDLSPDRPLGEQLAEKGVLTPTRGSLLIGQISN